MSFQIKIVAGLGVFQVASGSAARKTVRKMHAINEMLMLCGQVCMVPFFELGTCA